MLTSILKLLRSDIASINRNVFGLFFLLFSLINLSSVFADGSRELYPSGATGNRAFLYCATNGANTDSWPFKTQGTHYVYAKAGEEIAVASSAQGQGSGTINITDPSGKSYTSGSVTTAGFIKNRTQELAGPNNGVGAAGNRYTPYFITVTAATEGVWKVEFVAPKGIPGDNTVSVPDILADANWTQAITGTGNGNLIAAWDVSVRSGTTWMPGRTYTNVLNLLINANFEKKSSYYATHYILTKDGRAYRVQTNGNNGVGFTFFSNSNGFAVNSIPTYKSLNASTQADVMAFTHDPRSPDDGNNVTHKIFYSRPNSDLPASAPMFVSGTANATTWLKNTAVLPKISALEVRGIEGTLGQVSRKGAYINFQSTTGGTYKITIPVASGADRVIVGVAAVGNNSVFWDGKDANGVFVPAGTPLSQLKTKLLSAEVHFPYIDMEINPQGLIIELTDNTLNYNVVTTSTDEGIYSDKVYWNDVDITGAGPANKESSNPVTNTVTGISSRVNGHKWGLYTSNGGTGSVSFGDNRSMDTWAYIQGSEESQPMNITIKTADLMIESIKPTVTSYYSNQQLTYTIRVKNDGPSAVDDALFNFKAPLGFQISTINYTTSGGTAVVKNTTAVGGSYKSLLNLSNQAVVEFVIVGKVDATLFNKLLAVEASILRPADVTDPDATDPNSVSPTDPHAECYNGTGMSDCNNIKYNTVDPQELCFGAQIRPIEYILSLGGTSPRTIGIVPALLDNTYTTANRTTKVSGGINAAGTYDFTLGTLNSEKETTTAIIRVNPLPSITSQPVATPACEGTDAVFSVTSSGTTYQWQYEEAGVWKNFVDGADITGATTSALKIPAITLAYHGKKIRVAIASASGCSTTSNEITLVVNVRPPDTNIILGGKYICEGGSVQLRSSAIGAVGYQWFFNGAIIPGATQRSYNASAAGKYSVAVANAFGCLGTKSEESEVVVIAFPAVPNIIHGPLIVCIGNTVTLKSDPATTYQWYLGDDAISGATSQEYIAATSGDYSVVVTNIGGCSESSARVSVVISPLPVKPGISAGGAIVFCAGGQVILSSDAATGNQWYLNGTIIPSATGQTYTATAGGKYTVITTNGNGCASPASNEIDVTVNPLPVAPGISAGGAIVFCSGGQVILTSDVATGNQWYLNGVAIPNATGQTYTATVGGKYTVVTTNGNGCASPASNEIEVTVNPLPVAPRISAGGAIVFCAGGQVILTSDAVTGNQWYLNGAIIPNATGQTYTAAVGGKYTVITTNGNGCASLASNEIDVIVNPLPVAPVITAGTITVFCAGGQVILSSDAATGNQWYLNGAIIPNATGQTYTATVGGKYTVVTTNGNGCASPVSNEIEVTVNPLPVAPVITAGTTTVFCAGGEVVLSSDVATGNQWYLNGAAISGATGQTYTAIASGKYTVITTNGNGCASPVSNEIDIMVNPLPVAPVITAGTTTVFCAGGEVVLSSDVSTGNQWYLNGAAISGATGQTYTATASGKYTVITTNGNGCASPASNEIDVTVNPLPVAPVITAGTTTVFCAGGEVILTSDAATGNQWYLNGAAISGATGQTYTATASGKYTVITTNGNGCASPVSNEIDVTVNPLPVAPVITAGTTTVFCAGGEVVLSSDVATGNQWYLNGATISGATGQTYTATVSGKYTVITTNGNGCASPVSNEIDVTVNPLPVAPVITAGTTTVFCAGGEVVLSSDVATGNQWYLNGATISGATGQTYTAIASGKYTVITTNGNGCASVVSNEIDVTVNPLPVAPVITAGTTTVFCAGGEIVLSSDVATGNQWYLNGAAISGATGQTYTATAGGKYTVVTTNGNGCASPASNEIEVTVNPLPAAPGISAGGAIVFCAGGEVILTSDAATGNQWYLNSAAISGATGQTYTATASGKYTVITTNGNGCASPVSNEIEVTVNPLPSTPVVSVTTATVFCAGGEVVLSSDVGTGNQWYLNGAVISGATGQTYTATASGKYTVITTNGNGCASPVSNEIDVTVNPLPSTPVVSMTTATVFCAGGEVVLSSDVATGNQWYLNGVAIPNATGQTYTATVGGKYTVVTTNGNGCASPASNEIEVTVNPLPVAPGISAGGAIVFCAGGQVILTSDAVTGNQWYLNGAIIPNATGQTYTAAVGGKYTVITTNGNGCASLASNEIDVIVNPLPVAPVITAGTITVFCAGGQVILSSDAATGNQWYLNGAIIPNATGQTYTATVGGKYTVVTTNGNGCASPVSNEIEVTVNPLPVAPVITAGTTTVFCAGGEVILTSDAATGNQWYLNGAAISGATGQTYTATASGKYTVITTNGNGCASPVSNEIDVTVNPLPVAPVITAGTTTVFCAGGEVVLSSDVATGNQWYLNGTAIPNATGQTYTATASGKYTVITTNGNGCASPVSNEIDVTVNPLPVAPVITAGTTTVFCAGGEVVLSSDVATGNQWYLNGAVISGATGQTYTATAGGKYTVITTNGNGCASPVSNEIDVTVNPLPVAPVITAGTTTVFCVGGEVVLSSDVSTGNQWYLNGAAISGATGQTYTATASGKYTVITTNGNGCASPVSNEIDVTVNPLPVAPVITAGTTTVFCAGGEVVLSSDVSTGNQWYLNGAAISGATGQTYTATASGKYTVITTNGNGCASPVSNEIDVTVNPLPSTPVVSVTTATVFCAGGEVVLSSDVSTGNQWYLNGAAISGATGQTYTATASGKYTVITTNGNGCASPASNEIDVTVNPLPVAPVITAGTTTVFCAGGEVILTSDAATGNQWYLNGAAISGATGQTYTATASGKYTVITTNGNGCASPVSNEIDVTVNPLPVAPVITAGTTTVFCAGGEVVLSSDVATGNQWYLNGTAIPNATGQTYTATASGKYTVITTNGNGCASPVSNEIDVTVNPLPVAPVITAGTTTVFCAGGEVVLSSDVATGNQWYLNGAVISGATGQTYTATAGGKYTVITTNGNGCASPVSNEIDVTVNPLPVAPVITAGTTTVFCVGGEVVLSSDVSTGNQWYLNGAAISGATGQTYTATASGKYTVITTNGNGCASPVSNEIDVTVNPLPVAPVITAGTTTVFCAGGEVVLSSDVSTGNQWYLNGAAISGATGQTYTATASGKYTVITTNGNGCASPVSNEIDVTVNPLPSTPVVSVTTATVFCAGGEVVLSSDVSTGNQWYLNGAAISGATGQTYTATASGKYTVITTNGNGCASPASNEIDVTVNPLPVAPVITAGTTTVFCAGGEVILTSDAATGNQWYLNGAAISGATGQTYTATASGKYTVITTNGNGCASPVSNEIDVTVNPLPVAPVITAGTTTVFCAGGEVVLSSDVATGNQWYLNGATISGATGQTYTATVSGKYTVITTNGNGCASPVSNEIEVTVNALPVAPVITAGTTTVFCAGGEVVLSSDVATGNQWYLNGAAISGATGQTYTAIASGKYTVITTNGNGCASVVSNEIDVTVNPLPSTPVVSVTTATVFCAGGEVILSSDVATGNQWYLNGAVISGATGQTYTATAGGKYTVITTNGNGCASPVSNEIDVTVNPLPVAPVITAGTTTVFCAGGEVVLSSDVATGNQWYLNGAAISGATGQTYTATASGKYTVITTNGNGCASPVSNEIDVTVNPLPVAPVITAGTTTVFCAGGEVVLSSDVSTGNQWYLNGAAISGATGQTYTATASGKYTVITTNGNGCASPVSNEIDVTVNALPAKPGITGTAVICEGDVAVLTASAGTGYQWYLAGTAIPGATGQTYDAKVAGKYTVVITNANGCFSSVSDEFTLTVNALPPVPTIIVDADKLIFCEGGSVTLASSSATGNQWYKNGQIIPSAINTIYTTSETGNYTVKVTNASGCFLVSASKEVVVHALPVVPTIIVDTDQLIFCNGGSVMLTSSSETGNQWYKNGQIIPGEINKTYTTNEAGTYTVSVSNENGCAVVSASVRVTVHSLPVTPTVIVDANKLNFCVGSSVVLTSSSATGNQWYKDGQIIPGATNKTYIATTSGDYMVIVTNTNGCSSSPSQPVEVNAVPYPEVPEITPGGRTTFCEGRHVVLTSSSLTGNQWYKNGVLIPGATNQTYNVNQIGDYTVKVTNTTGCASGISAITNVTVNSVPKGYNDIINPLSCTQSSFSYNLQNNVDNTVKGGNAVPASFSWTVNQTAVTGASSGTGKIINATLINTSTTVQNVVYTVTPIAETGGCAGQPFTITVSVPVCIDIEISKTADKSSVSAVGDKIKYTITVRNNGNANHNQVVVNDPLLGGILKQPKGDNGNGILEKNESWVYEGIYTISQNDLDRNGIPLNGSGKIINTAEVSSLEYTSPKSATAEVAVQTNTSITLVKTGVMNRGFKTLTYTFKITNTGNVTLSNLDLTDAKIPGPITLKQTVLAPGVTLVATAEYTITEAEKVAGTVTNTATVNGFNNQGLKVTDVSGTAADNDDPTVIDITRYPEAIDDYASTKAEEEVVVPIVLNDRPAFFPLDVTTIDVKQLPANGILSLTKDGRVAYKPNKGFYGVERFTYKINDANGLSSNIAEVRIDVAPPPLEIPNTFTPNGDGKNDTFFIKGLENYEGVSFFVYNRWGDEVYRNLNYKNEWDGKGLNDGTYFYVLKLRKGRSEDTRRSWILIKR
ncbi:MAG: gliding motility-associated C-terminal domain-containing protein [Candidatus Pedobacter colombiensis]|uniref:Gliding motility-associated C-terminal domain-containing protein n=1 Tax=Candidatus Pedobacter colombiensis TaxID=3121371 RepID=A0AAJ5WAC6_9SPHI|nr:gliding motility-associated C-terminal domain-containing protein [Pedobacter sp.]WEK20946.1 MAG: gliding motility-associated C-terminal domain-containing protein [Pedobacter sp.]